MRIIFSDIETTKFKDNLNEFDLDFYELDFKLGCFIEFDFITEKEIYSFSTINFNEYLLELVSDLSIRKKKIIYYHNLTFDSKFFIDFLNSYFDNVKVLRTNSSIINIKCFKSRKYKSGNKIQYRNDCILEFKDSLSLFTHTSIAKLGKMVKLEKLEFDFDYSNEIQLKKAKEYCLNDCKIPFLALKQLSDFLNNTFDLYWKLKNLPLTIASLSKTLIKLFYPKIFYQVDKYMETNIRKFYFGGRTECFSFKLLKNGKYIDINSAYPSDMSKKDLSYGKCYRFSTHKIEFNNPNTIAMELTIRENNFYPLFPSRINNKVMFLNGIKTVLMTKYEYRYLEKHGYFTRKEIEIIEIHFVYYAYKRVNLKLLYRELYKIRKQYEKEFGKDYPYVYFIKILLNSGYGKFGQKPLRKSYEFVNDITDIDFDKETIIDTNNSLLREKEIFQKYLENNLINAILITSYVRFKIWKMLELCKKNSIEVYYTDTDSIVIEGKNLLSLQKYISNDLGKWSIETEFQEFQAIDSKEYYSIDLKRESGKEFLAKFKGIKNDYLNNKEKLKKHIELGTKVNQVGSFFLCQKRHKDSKTVFVITKHKNTYYHKRKINSDLTTNPNSINDDFELIEQENRILILKQLEIKRND